MRRLGTSIGAAAVAFAVFAAVPVATYACVSDQPTFAEAVRGARAIARVTIVEGFDASMDDATRSETYRIERVLKGSLPDLVTVAPASTSLCGDSVGYFAGAEGSTIVVAFDLRYYDQIIHPMWAVDPVDGVWGTAGVPSSVRTLPELEAAILRALRPPDTSTEVAQFPRAGGTVLGIVAGLAALATAILRFRRCWPAPSR